MDEETSTIMHLVETYAFPAIYAIIILIVGRILAKFICKIFRKVLTARKVEAAVISFCSNVLYFILLAIAIIAALEEVGINTTSAVAIVGACTVAIGFALKDSLGNFAAGVMILVFKPFRVGDFIQAAGISGSVVELSVFETQFKTPDNKKIVVPNGQITSGPITNFSAHDTRRMDLVVGVSYEDDLRKVQAVLEDILNNDECVLKDPTYTIGVLEMADSSVNFAVRPWVNSSDYWPTFFRLNMTIKLRFDEEGISIPFPQQDVHLHQVDPKPSA
ncbi:mechanosensitive ion channel domain-containing protein [Ruficoccus sp. ZRK36]|uniref:mechanosensitive ion channel family protein n=1 Tax=Ruficoccus sp. ZRK36 TaxID=2866311 RepID=UPI001C72FE0B|nr:mechanosensitive ion channel domain-containing protein [Ruficoccus sp. ZRK36]QYY35436.1 mechanosensitive ion channel [Ruficoccus sp. ZRK36]